MEELNAAMKAAYKSALQVVASIPWTTSRSPRPVSDPQYTGRPPELHRGLPVPELAWINLWIKHERAILALYRRDQAALVIIPEASRRRVIEAVRRIKELEHLIKTYYQGAIINE